MTPEEAIKTITQMLNEFCNEDSYAPECKDAVDMAISALAEQIPRKPQEGNVHIAYVCPNCGCVQCGGEWDDE